MPWDQAKVDQWYQQNLARGANKAQLDAIVQQKQADYLVKQKVPAAEIETTPIGMRAQVQEVATSGYKPSEAATTEGQRKAGGQASSGIRALETVKEIYEKDPLILEKQLIPWKLKSRTFDSALFDSVDTLLRLRTGATAPKSEVRDYMRSFGPKIGDKPKDVEHKLNQLQFDLLAEAGQSEKFKPIKVTPPKEGKPEALVKGLFNTLLGGAYKTFKDIGTGMTVKGSGAIEAQQGLMQQGEQLAERAQTVQDPVERKRLLQEAQGIFSQTSAGAKGISEQFTEDVQRSPISRGIETGAEIASIPAIMSAVKNLPKLKGKIRSPVKVWGEARKAAAKASGKTMDTGKFMKAAKKYVELDPGAAGYLEKNIKVIKAAKNPSALLERMKIWSKAYTSAGRAGKSSKAGLFDVLYKAGSKEMAKKAPEVAKYTKYMRISYQLPKALKKIIWYGGVPAGIYSGVKGATKAISGE